VVHSMLLASSRTGSYCGLYVGPTGRRYTTRTDFKIPSDVDDSVIHASEDARRQREANLAKFYSRLFCVDANVTVTCLQHKNNTSSAP
jgi:hypothetical protein